MTYDWSAIYKFFFIVRSIIFSVSPLMQILKIHLLNKKSHTAKNMNIFIFFSRIELIVIQLGTFVKISSIPEATIFTANAFLFLRIIYPTSVTNVFLFLCVPWAQQRHLLSVILSPLKFFKEILDSNYFICDIQCVKLHFLYKNFSSQVPELVGHLPCMWQAWI